MRLSFRKIILHLKVGEIWKTYKEHKHIPLNYAIIKYRRVKFITTLAEWFNERCFKFARAKIGVSPNTFSVRRRAKTLTTLKFIGARYLLRFPHEELTPYARLKSSRLSATLPHSRHSRSRVAAGKAALDLDRVCSCDAKQFARMIYRAN